MSIYLELPNKSQNTEEHYSSMFNILLKCSFVIVILSVTNLITYYYSFNIQIVNYLDMTEITTLFLTMLPDYLLLLIPIIILIFHRSTFLWIQLSLFLFVIYVITSNTNVQAKWQFFVICFTLYSPVFIYVYKHKAKGNLLSYFRKNSKNLKFKLITYIVVSSILATCINSMLNVMLIKNRNLYYGTEMILEGKKVISDSTFYYVGQTRNYIFWYNAQSKSAKIYPTGKLQELMINTVDIEKYFEAPVNADCDSLYTN
jgi:hypothetical protein